MKKRERAKLKEREIGNERERERVCVRIKE